VLGHIKFDAVRKGMYASSVYASQVHHAHVSELETWSVIAWQSMVRALVTSLATPTNELRSELKTELNQQISKFAAELTLSLIESLKHLPVSTQLTLVTATKNQIEKHEIEIDLYLDTIIKNTVITGPESSQQYNFYGTVGVIQTGASSEANLVQNIGVENRSALSSALSQVKEVIQNSFEIPEQKQNDLLKIATECESEISSTTPNNTKLLTLFNVLGLSIQSIASAKPAYEALKIALLAVGVSLP
jgi:hypothetical protein